MTQSSLSRYDNNLSQWLNILGLLCISAVLIVAFYYQFALFELPCPLCLLQRVGIVMIGMGFLFNVSFGVRGAHYGIALIGCVITGVIAARQMFLHIMPGDLGYGSTFLGLHFYTWALISSILAVVGISVMLMLSRNDIAIESQAGGFFWGKIAMVLFSLLITANLASTVLECGSGQCADNPTFYQLFEQ
ncbi:MULTISPECIES: disulfide bond formation protein B [Yersiniaceae]|uniref:disulfide bond formation protein B n=1 Tax=Yersiniaceae TaxID=1903411 RepID=UPI00119CA2B9|nr:MULTISPECIES: disulfide bond formation protein B [Yersiniaceae]ULG10456.1 disulfide bond formation protein [Serratia entomophila]CAI2011209.1 disulfide bond formation protein B [Serratia entomophila]